MDRSDKEYPIVFGNETHFTIDTLNRKDYQIGLDRTNGNVIVNQEYRGLAHGSSKFSSEFVADCYRNCYGGISLPFKFTYIKIDGDENNRFDKEGNVNIGFAEGVILIRIPSTYVARIREGKKVLWKRPRLHKRKIKS